MALSKDEVIKMTSLFLDIIRNSHDISQAYLFGSFANDKAEEYSDVDLAIVLGSEDKSKEGPFGEAFEIFHEAQKYNSLIEVICFLQEEFEEGGGALIKKIKTEGVRLV